MRANSSLMPQVENTTSTSRRRSAWRGKSAAVTYSGNKSVSVASSALRPRPKTRSSCQGWLPHRAEGTKGAGMGYYLVAWMGRVKPGSVGGLAVFPQPILPHHPEHPETVAHGIEVGFLIGIARGDGQFVDA